MALSDHLSSARRASSTGLPCSIGKLLAELPTADKETLETWLREGFSGRRIYEALKAEGHEVGHQTVNRHRSGGCRCFQ